MTIDYQTDRFRKGHLKRNDYRPAIFYSTSPNPSSPRLRRDFVLCLLSSVFCFLWLTGCRSSGNIGNVFNYPIPSVEAAWIRNGEPVEFEGELWFPADGVENFQDTEMFLAGEYKGIQFFVDRTDVRPYQRIYTKFDRNKFRFFEKRTRP